MLARMFLMYMNNDLRNRITNDPRVQPIEPYVAVVSISLEELPSQPILPLMLS